MKTNYGISNEAVECLTDLIHRILADNYVLYVKTLNCHWNIEDPRFIALHEMLDDQYTKIAANGDELAERIRIMGKKVSGSLKFFLQNSTLPEIETDLSGEQMIEELARSHENVIELLRKTVAAAEDANDPGTVDMITGILRFHEKTAWFLRSHL